MDTLSNKITESFKSFSSDATINGSREFLESNSIVAKFAFLLLILLVFVILLRIGSVLIGMAFTPSSSPILIDGMIDGKQFKRITQNPSLKDSKPIIRSKNEDSGLSFTWSVWINIDDLEYKKGQYRHIFHKGNDALNDEGMVYPNNSPGLYIAPYTNKLVVVMNTFDDILEEVDIDNIPLNKWINVIIIVDQQYNLSVYINGMLAKKHTLSSIPRQNYEDVYISMNGGYSGYTSNLRYYNKAISYSEIQSIIYKGPSLNMIGKTMSTSPKDSQFLSLNWYLYN